MTLFSGEDAARWCHSVWSPQPPRRITGVSTDTRALASGHLFVALHGPRFDGHDFVPAAFERGACGAVVRRGFAWCVSSEHALLFVDDPGRALQDLGAGYRAALAPEIVAVTGSAGKTTVKEMAADLLDTLAPTARTRGNWNNEIGIPLSLLAMQPSHKIGVFEVGVSHPGEMASLGRMLKPSWVIVTNVGPVHLEFLETEEGVAREKGQLLRELGTDGTAILPGDSPWFPFLRSAVAGRVVTVAMTGEADYVCRETRCLADGGTAVLVEEARQAAVREEIYVPVPGRHNVRNALLAVALAREHGVAWDAIRSALRRYRPLPMRWESQVVAGVVVVNDAYNANPMSMRAAIETFERMRVEGRRWLVLGSMLELGRGEEEEHLALGRHLATGPWAGLIVVGPLGTRIARGAQAAGMAEERIMCCGTPAEAAEVLATRAAAGDAVLLKASRSIHLEQTIECWTRRVAEGSAETAGRSNRRGAP